MRKLKYLMRINTAKLMFTFSAFALSILSCAKVYTDPLPEPPPGPAQPTISEHFEKIIERIGMDERGAITDVQPITLIVKGYVSSIESDGTFSTINYLDQSQTNWDPINHLNRVKQMALCYTLPSSSEYANPVLYEKIEKALNAWDEKKPRSSNWWYNQINSPRMIGQILVIMRSGIKRVPAELEKRLLTYIERTGGDPRERTGANKSDIALHWLYRGCLMENQEVVSIASNEVYSVLEYTTEEGLQHDGSYFQHNQQLYIGGYGDVLISTVARFAFFTMDTPFFIPLGKLSVLRSFVMDTYLNVIRGQYMFFNVGGRSVSRENALLQSGFSTHLTRMKIFDPITSNAYEAAISRLTGVQSSSFNIFPSNTHYFVGDYMVHQRPNYAIGIRTVSERTYRSEEGNGENTKGYFLSDGSMNISLVGNEYQNIFPTWDWAKIPGVTSPNFTNLPSMGSSWTHLGESKFTGGVSDGQYGVSVYNMNNQADGVNTAAKKAWFMFDKEVVCLGSGIGSTSGLEVNTTLNQCFLSGSPTISINGVERQINKGETQTFDQVDWVFHNKIGYYLPRRGRLTVSAKQQTGKWSDINTTQSSSTTFKDVFTTWLEHGTNPQNGEYAYIIVPNLINSAELKTYVSANEIEILMNTSNVQAVLNKSLGIIQVVFYNAGTFNQNGFSITSDKGCVLMIKNITSNSPSIYASDPSHRGVTVNLDVTINGKKFKSEQFSFSSTPSEGGKTKSSQLKN